MYAPRTHYKITISKQKAKTKESTQSQQQQQFLVCENIRQQHFISGCVAVWQWLNMYDSSSPIHFAEMKKREPNLFYFAIYIFHYSDRERLRQKSARYDSHGWATKTTKQQYTHEKE